MQTWLQVKSEVRTCTGFGEREAKDCKLPLKVLKSSLVCLVPRIDQINPRGARKGRASHRTTHSAWVRGCSLVDEGLINEKALEGFEAEMHVIPPRSPDLNSTNREYVPYCEELHSYRAPSYLREYHG